MINIIKKIFKKKQAFLSWEDARVKTKYYHLHANGVYRYRLNDQNETLVEDGKVLVGNVKYSWWHEPGAYSYTYNGDDWIHVKNGTLININEK